VALLNGAIFGLLSPQEKATFNVQSSAGLC
jgi:hypothetical protein